MFPPEYPRLLAFLSPAAPQRAWTRDVLVQNACGGGEFLGHKEEELCGRKAPPPKALT